MTRPAFSRFRALGALVVVGVTDPAALESAVAEVRLELDACDRACSRFRPDSELSKINVMRGRKDVEVSAWLVDALTVARHAAAETDGLVDPTLGARLIAIGYDRSFDQMQLDGGPVTFGAHRVDAWRSISTDLRHRRVSVPAGITLDLGATAKALCADRAAARAEIRTGTGVLVSIGGDLRIAGQAPGHGWDIRVTDRADTPPDSPAPGQTVSLEAGGLATSGISVRRWKRGDEVLHHLINPVTGRPADSPWRTVSVSAASCVEANIASTAAVLLGPTAPAWLAMRGLPARLVDHAGGVRTTSGWPDDTPTPRPDSQARAA
jgi:thiamine biosynthesis lipoprotein ApbE